MRFRFLAALLAAILVGGTYWYVTTAYICPTPLSYRLGQLDDHFAITAEEAIAHMATAESVWEQAAGRELFVYDESADFVVDFVFDDRQALADSESAQSAALDERRQESEALFATIEELQTNYENLSNTYRNRVASYEERLAAYNQTVRQYNDQGGAPAEAYQALQSEQRALDTESGELQSQAAELNTVADRLNTLAAQSNQLIETYNREVQRFNRQFGYSREFTQGDYQGDRINIYKFSSDAELITVLTHEFGHALGIDHVDADNSIMYYLLVDESENPVLTEADTAALFETCGTGDELKHTLRRVIRTALAAVTI